MIPPSLEKLRDKLVKELPLADYKDGFTDGVNAVLAEAEKLVGFLRHESMTCYWLESEDKMMCRCGLTKALDNWAKFTGSVK